MGTFRAVKIVHREDFARDRPFTREYEGLLKYEPISRSHPNLMQILHVGRREEYFFYVTELADDANAEHPNAECGMRNAEQASPVDRERKPPSAQRGNREEVEAERPGDVPRSALPAPRLLDPQSYVPRTLQEDLERRRRLPIKECVPLAVALASALKHLHDHELVHRDVKPSNVIFVHGVPKLADIGLVATVGDSRSIVGTEGYLPPEGPGNPQADLYSLGKLLYEVSTGLNRRDYPRLPQDLREWPDAQELLEFNEVLLRACAKDTEQRYHQAGELLADLALLERGASVKRLRRLERHHAVLRRIGVGLLAAGLVISAAWWQSWRAHRIARRHLAQLHVNVGTESMVQGDYSAALPWLVGALDLDAGDRALERVHRTRIASVLDRCPRPVAHFSVRESKVLAADLTPDGAVLATAHEDGSVRLWDTRSGALLNRQLRLGFPVMFCRFLPSGEHLLAATLGQKVHLWNLANPEVEPLAFPQVVEVKSFEVYSVGLNATLRRAYLSKSRHRFARVHDFSGPFENLTLAMKLVGQGDALLIRYQIRKPAPEDAVLFEGEFRDSPEADPLAEGLDTPAGPLWGRVWVMLEDVSVGDQPGDRSRVVWDNVRVRQHPNAQSPPPWQVLDDFSSGELIDWIIVCPPASQRTYQVEGGQLVMSYAELPPAQRPDSSAIHLRPFEISHDHTLEIEVDLVSAQARHPTVGVVVFRPTLGPSQTPDWTLIVRDRWLALTWFNATVRIWDLEKGKFVTASSDGREEPLELKHTDWITDVDISPDGQHLVSVEADGRGSVWDLRTGHRITPPIPQLTNISGARLSPDGHLLALSSTNGLALIRTEDWQPVQTLDPGASLAGPRFSPLGNRLAAVRDQRTVVVWDLGDLDTPPATVPHMFPVRRIAFSPDGRYVASDAQDDPVRVWDLTRGQALGPPLPGTLGRFSADGCQLMLFGAEGGVWLWELTHLADEPLAVPPPAAMNEPLASSRDRTMTAESHGQTVTLKTPTGRYSLAHPVPVRRALFTADNQYLIAETTDLRSWIWDLNSRTLATPPLPTRYDAALPDAPSLELPVESRDRRTLVEWAALLGGQRFDGKGGMEPLDHEARARLFGELQKTRPREFSLDDDKRQHWHEQQAEQSEQGRAWDAAAFHWEQALKLKSEVPNPKSEVGNVQSAIRNPQSAIALESRLAYARQAAEAVRSELLRGGSRWAAIPPRQPWAAQGMLDLAGLYTQPLGQALSAKQLAYSFRELPNGVQTLGGIGFDVRGIIRVPRTNQVTIPVNRPCRRIHFLHAASKEAAGSRETAGIYQATYASGERARVELLNPQDLPPYQPTEFFWLSRRASTNAPAGLSRVPAWAGCTPDLARHDQALFLTRTTWTLPTSHNGEIVATLELQGGPSSSAPLVFAITVE
jgi:WD40 repeat protein